MPASQALNNPKLKSLSHAFEGVLTKLAQVPMDVWKNLVIIGALFWICHSVATLFWVFVPVPQPNAPRVLAEAPTGSSASSSGPQVVSVDVGTLQSANIFGKPGELIAVEPEPEPELNPEGEYESTQLNLDLQGVVNSSDPKLARAIIASGSKQDLYKIGDELSISGVKLEKIETKRVLIDNRGKIQALWLYSEEDFKRTEAQRARRPVTNTISAAAPRTVSIPRERVPKSISDVVRFSVHREDGRMIGYRVRPGRDRELFEEVGLQVNDVVTSVNGIAVDDPQQIRAVYQSLRTATQAQLEILRDGQTQFINISLDI